MENDINKKSSPIDAPNVDPVVQNGGAVASPAANPYTRPMTTPQNLNALGNQQLPNTQQFTNPNQQIYVQPDMEDKNNVKRKRGWLIGVVVLIVIAIIGAVIVVKMSGGDLSVNEVESAKTLSCSWHHNMAGVVGDELYTFKIDDGKIRQMIVNLDIDLSESNFDFGDGTEEEWAKEKIAGDQASCESGCIYESKYERGKFLKEVFVYDSSAAEELLGGDVSKYTADEIVEKTKKALENAVDTGMGYKCEVK